MPYAEISEQAEDDLSDIWAYVALDNTAAADKLISTLRQKCQLLAEFPGGGPERPELSRGLRSFPVGNYVIFYRPAPHGVDVARVIHGKRNIKRIFRKRKI